MTRISLFAFFLVARAAHAQIQNEPVEIISAPAPAPFSERSGLWPVDTLPEETFTNDRSTLNDRWNSVPGVQARETGSPTISIRGSAQADRVLKLFDGAPLNMADGVGGSDLFVPIEVLADVSLMKGPASVFYGTSAMAGAIDHRLKYFDRPTLTGSLADAGGEFGDRRVAFIVPITNHDHKPVAQLSVMSDRNPGNFLYQSTTSSQAGRRDGNLQDLERATAAADLDLGSGWSVSARLIEARNQGESSGSLYSPLHSTFNTTGSLATAQVEKHFSASTLASLRVSDVRIWGLYDEGTSVQSTSMTSKTSLNADFDIDLSNSLLLKSFADVSMSKLTASYVAGSEFYESDADLGQSLEVSLTPQLSIQPACRYQSRYGQIFKSFAAILADRQMTYSFKIGEGFRSPSLTDRFASFYTYIPNPSLKPEREWSAELGANYEEGHRTSGFLEGLATKASVYFASYNDLVDNQTINSKIQKVNVGEAQSYGAEANIAYGYKIWTASLGYNYLESKNLTVNEPLRLAPRHQAVVTLAQLFGPLLLEAKETLWSTFFDRDTGSGTLKELPAWQTLDLTFRTLALTSWEFRGGILNLFDQSRELTYGYPEPQRRFFLSASRFL